MMIAGCNAKVDRTPPVEDISGPPLVNTAVDIPYMNVYQPLDGIWEGSFYIYEDTLGQRAQPVQPTDIEGLSRETMPLRLQQTIKVRQEYVSETPLFQRVRITDEYRDAAGNLKTVESHGANKVQDGKMWCVVVKPDETVVHQGELAAPGVIIWSRSIKDPLKIEYFRETVKDSSYQIWGWGYYGDADPQKSPPLWFYGDYQRQ